MIPATFRSVSGEDVLALRITNENLREVAAWTDGELVRTSKQPFSPRIDGVSVRFISIHGPVYANVGDWIVQQESGVFRFQRYPNHIFHTIYAYI